MMPATLIIKEKIKENEQLEIKLKNAQIEMDRLKQTKKCFKNNASNKQN
jgi:hypothetical protein